jgi:hypothetical protein
MSTITSGNTTTTKLTFASDTTGILNLVSNNGTIELTNTTGAITIPKGTTAERPQTPITGTIRYNTTNNVMELYTGNVWINFS